MKLSTVLMVVSATALTVSTAKAETRLIEGPEPIEVYTVCSHNALYAINDRAVLIKHGGKTLIDSGSTFTIGYEPDVFLQTKHLVRHSYRSLSASGDC